MASYRNIANIKGPKGDRGVIGSTPKLTVGNVTPVTDPVQAGASIRGTAAAPILDLDLPRGLAGPDVEPTDDLVGGLIQTEGTATRGQVRSYVDGHVEERLSEPLLLPDGVGEWWIHPLATQLNDPYPRTVFGGISATGMILVNEFNYATGRTRRWEVAQAGVDDHNVPAVWIEAGRRPLIAWTNHSADNFLRLKVGARNGDLSSFTAAPEVSRNIGGGASYAQIHKIEHLSSATEDVFYIFTRRTVLMWGVQQVTVSQSSGQVTFGTWFPVVSAAEQCYLSVADAFTPDGENQVLRIGWGYNPARDDKSICYMELDVVTGLITSPADVQFSNTLGTQITPADIAPVIPTYSGSRRFFYTRPGPDGPAIAYADWAIGQEDDAEYRMTEISSVPDQEGPLDLSSGHIETSGRAPFDATEGFIAEACIRVPDTETHIDLINQWATNSFGAFRVRLTPAGNIDFLMIAPSGQQLEQNTSSGPLAEYMTPDTEIGVRVRLDLTLAEPRITRSYSLDRGQTWTEIGIGSPVASPVQSAGLRNDSTPLRVGPASVNSAHGVVVFNAYLRDLTGTPLAGFDFVAGDWQGDPSATDAQGNEWSLFGDAFVSSTDTRLDLDDFTFGISGTRIGHTSQANYIAGMAFETPSMNRKLVTVHTDGIGETVRVWRPEGQGFVDEVAAQEDTVDGRLIRPFIPLGSTTETLGLTRMRSYAGFTNYEGDQVIY